MERSVGEVLPSVSTNRENVRRLDENNFETKFFLKFLSFLHFLMSCLLF